jgi:hypothetical protein
MCKVFSSKKFLRNDIGGYPESSVSIHSDSFTEYCVLSCLHACNLLFKYDENVKADIFNYVDYSLTIK